MTTSKQYRLPALTGIPVLTGSSNYLEWAKQMRNALKLWGVYTAFKKATAREAPVPLSEHDNAVVFFAICGTTSGTARIDIDGIDDDSATCGVQAWQALEDRYQRVDQTTKTVLKKQFEALTIAAYDTIDDFLAGVRAMRRELQVHGIQKSNEDTVERILEAARADDRYKDVASLFDKDDDIPTLPRVEAVLQRRAQTIGHAEFKTHVLDSTQAGSEIVMRVQQVQEKTQQLQRSNYDNIEDVPVPASWTTVRTDKKIRSRDGKLHDIMLYKVSHTRHIRQLRCTRCFGFGHLGNVCPTVNYTPTGEVYERPTRSSTSRGQTESAMAALPADDENINGTHTDRWLCDTACTRHLSGQRTPIHNTRHETRLIRGIGGQERSHCCGDVKTGRLTLKRVMLLSRQCESLLSVPQGIREGHGFIFTPQTGAILPKVEKVTMETGRIIVDFQSTAVGLDCNNGMFYYSPQSSTLPKSETALQASTETLQTSDHSDINRRVRWVDELDDTNSTDNVNTATKRNNTNHDDPTRATRDTSTQTCHTDDDTPDKLTPGQLWHLRTHFRAMEAVHECPMDDATCETCLIERSTASPHTGRLDSEPGTYYTDLWGPRATPSRNGARYAMIFVHPYTGYIRVFFLRSKSENDVIATTLLMHQDMQTSDFPMRQLTSDNESALKSINGSAKLRAQGIRFIPTPPATPQRNGFAETQWRTLNELGNCYLRYADLPENLWALAWRHAANVYNASLVRNQPVTPFEAHFGKRVPLSSFRIFGCPAYGVLPKHMRRKGDSRAFKGYYVGFNPFEQGFLILIPGRTQLVRTGNARFNESWRLPRHTTLPSSKPYFHRTDAPATPDVLPQPVPSEHPQDSLPVTAPQLSSRSSPALLGRHVHRHFSANTNNTGGTYTGVIDRITHPDSHPSKNWYHVKYSDGDSELLSEQSARDCLRDTATGGKTADTDTDYETALIARTHAAATAYAAETAPATEVRQTDFEPATIKQALNSDRKEEWIAAYNEELDGMEANNTYDLIDEHDIPHGKKAISSKMVHKLKRDEKSRVYRYKARCTARGDQTTEGIDFSETFAPTTKIETLRLIIATVMMLGLQLFGFDVDQAYLNGILEEEIYLRFPPEIASFRPQYRGKIARLKKGIYGLCQSGRTWYERFAEWMVSRGYIQSPSDPCLFYNQSRSIWVLMYVDDGHVACTDYDEYVKLCAELEEEFKIKKTGKITFTLGMQLDWTNDSVRIHQHAYTKNIIERYAIKAKHATSPATVGTLDLERCPKELLEKVDATRYRALVGSLMYLATCTRPDISTAVNRCARYMSDPRKIHENALDRILQYLRRQPELGITYHRNGHQQLIGYSDSNLGGDTGFERSRGGHVIFLANGPIYWRSKIHTSTAISSCESEYVELSECILTVKYLRNLMTELNVDVVCPTDISVDNTSAIQIMQNPQSSKRTRHIQLRYYMSKEAVENREVLIRYVSSDHNTADIFTKPLQGELLVRHTSKLCG